MWTSQGSLLWLQFAYALWQFVREAKFFRIPYALFYHTCKWIARAPNFGPPFSIATFSLLTQGAKWTFPNSSLAPGDLSLGGGHYLQRRNGTSFIIDTSSIRNSHLLAGRGTQIICSKVDWLVPKVCVADAYSWAEGFEAFSKEGATENTFTARALFTGSKEQFLNRNFTRLLSIVPLMLQAKGFKSLSIYASIGIIVLDQASYLANSVWSAVKDVVVSLTRMGLSYVGGVQSREFLSTFFSTLSPRLTINDRVVRNFYYVPKGTTVRVFGISSADHFHEGSISTLPEVDNFNPFQELSAEDCSALARGVGVDLEQRFGIRIGSSFLEHRVGNARILTFFNLQHRAYYNFIDNDHLHYGSLQVQGDEGLESQRVNRIRLALKWIENAGRMPVRCSSGGKLEAVNFNSFVDKVQGGSGVLTATVKRGSWVQ